jgi:rhamnosyltransferase
MLVVGPVGTAAASVIVRCKNEARTLGATLDALERQTTRAEIIVIDSGSTDGSRELAAGRCDRLLDMAPESFTYGRALNLGASVASAPIHFACSAHCYPREDWVERSLAHYRREDVAGTNGIQTFADGTIVREVFYQDSAHATSNADWGFSNHASSWRGSVWERFPFDERLDYAEDREWSWRVTAAGYVIAFDPALFVGLSHSWQGARNTFERRRRAARALRAFAPMPRYTARDALAEWWRDIPADGHSPAFHRLNPVRMAGLAGKWSGYRAALEGAWRDPAS